MACFPNYGQAPCPTILARVTYNYDAVDSETTTAIVDLLLRLAKKDLVPVRGPVGMPGGE